jgi:hypothetical protein
LVSSSELRCGRENVVKKRITVAVFALLAAALILSSQEALAGNCCNGGFGTPAVYSLSSIRIKGWIELHRPDGEVVHIQVDQIVLVMSATNVSANKRALTRVQLANGFADVLESVDEVMQAIKDDDSIA